MSSKPYPLSFSVWAIADLHLSFGIKGKAMDYFGEEWKNWTDKIKMHWENNIGSNDLVLIPGDISWAMRPVEAVTDLNWIEALPGTKVMIRGNHDYWWESKTKVEKILTPSIHILQNSVFNFQNLSIGGARLWDTPEYCFNDFIIFKENSRGQALEEYTNDPARDEKIFERELSRLELSLKQLNQQASYRIVMTHYPPISSNLLNSRASQLLEKYRADISVFGHLHSLKPNSLPFGTKNGVQYHLASCDYLDFKPLKIL